MAQAFTCVMRKRAGHSTIPAQLGKGHLSRRAGVVSKKGEIRTFGQGPMRKKEALGTFGQGQ